MDVKGLIESLKEDLTCSICMGYFTDPVTIKCGHSFCTQCLLQCREGGDDIVTCPECRGVINYRNWIPNKSLQNLSNTGKMLRPHLLQSMVYLTTCDQHGEKEKLFCEEDQISLCESCSLAPEHKDHYVLPLDKAAEKCKDKLQEIQNILQRKEEKFKFSLDKVQMREEYCKEDTYVLKQSVISEYEKIYQFLLNEENQHLKRLEQESRNTLAKFEENEVKLTQQIQNLQRMILKVEENLEKAPSEMPQDMKGTLSRNEELLLQKPKVASFVFSTWPITGLREVLMSFQRDIILDPESASPHLILSEDLKCAKYKRIPKDLLDYKEILDNTFIVLGAQTFTSGRHYWEVEIGDNTDWEVGVCKESVSRKMSCSTLLGDKIALEGYKSQNDFCIWKLQEGCIVKKPIDKVGIFLDYGKGHVAFYNVTEETLLYSPPNIIFQGPLRPYFSLSIHCEEGPPGSLIICPQE
ncbi:probable E3 ubiquitin-protein ligase TRIML1 [Dromiciops gliroides]|uniref:probable E3 ubiquitin-protein ligase TRIML1 n=1 Tax=Dromiciops gliroides TaxID=33562 RepID=UPI001CC44EAA|nr:probable E3 ubiquitin-protein ligase TRIML1 [Dromiciops gliroides]